MTQTQTSGSNVSDFDRRLLRYEAAADASDDDRAQLLTMLGEDRAAVLRDGLTALDGSRREQLLESGALSAALADVVLVEGGPYWDRVLAADPELEEERQRVFAEWPAVPRPEDVGPAPPTGEDRPEPAARSPLPSPFRHLAAATLLGVAAFAAWSTWVQPAADVTAGPSVAWENGLPAAPRTESQLLNAMSSSSRAWGETLPRTRAELEEETRRFLVGCDRVQRLRDPRLSPPTGDRLRAKCERWARSLEAQLARIEGDGPLPDGELADARSEIQTIVRKLSDALEAGLPESTAGGGGGGRRPDGLA